MEAHWIPPTPGGWTDLKGIGNLTVKISERATAHLAAAGIDGEQTAAGYTAAIDQMNREAEESGGPADRLFFWRGTAFSYDTKQIITLAEGQESGWDELDALTVAAMHMIVEKPEYAAHSLSFYSRAESHRRTQAITIYPGHRFPHVEGKADRTAALRALLREMTQQQKRPATEIIADLADTIAAIVPSDKDISLPF